MDTWVRNRNFNNGYNKDSTLQKKRSVNWSMAIETILLKRDREEKAEKLNRTTVTGEKTTSRFNIYKIGILGKMLN